MDKIKIISKASRKDGVAFKIQLNQKVLEVILTFHALERMKRWRLKELEVLSALVFAEEVVIGHGNRFIAHKARNKHIIRIIYEYQNDTPMIATIYIPSKARYFQGGGKYADKLFP